MFVSFSPLQGSAKRSSIFKQFVRHCSKIQRNNRPEAVQKQLDLSRALSEAEKIVGYPTSFLNLRWLLTDELANVVLYFRKLHETNHPILETARKLFIGSNVHAWGLVVLLVSKTGGLHKNLGENEKDLTAGVLYSQRALAEVTEMIRTGNLIHKSLVNCLEGTEKNMPEMNFGNKIALLSGDHLLGKSMHELACLRDQELNAMMGCALRDLVEAEFVGPRDRQDNPLPCKPTNVQNSAVVADQFGLEPYVVKEVLGNPRAEWTLRNILAGASLLGRSCQGALKLGHHSEDTQRLGYLFGKNVTLAWQAKVDQEPFLPGSSGPFSLISAPVMLHLQHEPDSYEKIEKGLEDVSEVDYDDLRRTIRSGPALQSALNLQKQHASNALEALHKFPLSNARVALENIVYTLL